MPKHELLRNPVQINEIFFSGSQSVKKGEQVAWVLDDTWAFQLTEDCMISCNGSPFVRVSQGQIFIIYKRTAEDEAEDNLKGIYIFDRDTVVGLAYPQEVTQDLIIENDNYNNNYNNNLIIVEGSDKPPVAHISINPSNPIVGDTVTVDGSGSYAWDPATITGYEWRLNGQPMGTGSSFTYTPDSAGQDDVYLKVTDSNGLVGTSEKSIIVGEQPELPDIILEQTSPAGGRGLQDGTYEVFNNLVADEGGTGTLYVSATCPAENQNYDGCEVTLYIQKNGSDIPWANGSISIPNYGSGVITINSSILNFTINAGDVFSGYVKRTYGDNYWAFGTEVGANPQLQIRLAR